MIRQRCVCGRQLQGLAVSGPSRFTFIPSSSLAHYNYELPFEDGVHLPGGRVLELCPACGALTFCPYPPFNGVERGNDPMITNGPGTVYEQCDLASIPPTYRSFRALMSSGVTGGIMYSDAFKDNLADLYHTDVDRLPSWKVVKDALLDHGNTSLDEWWSAAIGRNFIVLYENAKVLRPVASWHRIPGTEPRNEQIETLRALNKDPLARFAADTTEVSEAERQLSIPNDRRRLLSIGNAARLRIIESSIQIGRTLTDMPQWAPASALRDGNELFKEHAVGQLDETVYGIWHALVHDPDLRYDAQVDVLLRHNALAKVTCSCDEGQARHICKHVTATVLELGRRFQFRVAVPDARLERSGGNLAARHRDSALDSDRYRHYADALTLIHEGAGDAPRYGWLTAYIDPIEHSTESLYHIEFMAVDPAGRHKVGLCVYSKVMLSFIEEVIHHDAGDYAKVLDRYGLEKNVTLSILNVETLDGMLIKALVTMLVHQEKSHEGILAESLENGTLLRMLRRLAAIDAESGPKGPKRAQPNA